MSNQVFVINKRKMKKNKYNAVKTHGYDSRGEYLRSIELKQMQKEGLISNLKKQVSFILLDKFIDSAGSSENSFKYVADFCYDQNGHEVVEDFKSEATARKKDYILKRKLFKFFYPEKIFFENVSWKNVDENKGKIKKLEKCISFINKSNSLERKRLSEKFIRKEEQRSCQRCDFVGSASIMSIEGGVALCFSCNKKEYKEYNELLDKSPSIDGIKEGNKQSKIFRKKNQIAKLKKSSTN